MARAEQSLERQLKAAELHAAEVAGGLFLSEAERAALKAISGERKRFETWRTVWKQWALKGQEPDGYPYPVSFWLRIASDMAGALKTYSKGLYEANWTVILSNTARATVDDVASPSAWPTWLKVAMGLAAAGAVLVAINNAAALVRAARGA